MTRKRLTIAFILALASAGGLGAWWVRDFRHCPIVFNGPMVQQVTPESFTVTWDLDPDIPARLAVLADDNTAVGSVQTSRIKDPVTTARSRWSAVVIGLQPDRVYRYQISAKRASGQDILLSTHPVRTAASSNKPFRFVVLGDTGTGTLVQYRVARQLSTWTPDLVLHAGDIVTPKADRKELPARFFTPYADLLASVPMYACLGNHDYRVEQGQPILDTFVLPDNGPAGEQTGRHYWFDWGDARFIVVDSNHDLPYFTNVVAPWLDRILAEAGNRWTFIVWHEPACTHGSMYPPAEKLRRSLVPVLDRHHCTLVFSGHQHLYERSRPLRTGQVVPPNEGTVYVVTGTGGSNLYSELTPQSPLIATACDTQYGFTVVDVTPGRLTLRQIGTNGELIDDHLIER